MQWRIQGRGPGGPTPAYFQSKLGPEGPKPKKNFLETSPPPLSNGLEDRPPPLISRSGSGNSMLRWHPGGGRGGVLPYIILLYGYVPPNGVVILKLLIWNVVSISEVFSRTGYNISNARKLQFCKRPFEIIQGQIAFKNTVQCVNKQTVVLLLHPAF